MIARNRHSEQTKDGKPIFVIKTYIKEVDKTGAQKVTDQLNDEYNGEKYGVIFRNGVGRTTSLQKAKMLSEQFDYVVFVHKNVEKWKDAVDGKLAPTLEFEDESEDLYLDDEEEDEVDAE